MTQTVEEMVERLRRSARCVYIAVEESVAADLDGTMNKAANLLTATEAERAALAKRVEELERERESRSLRQIATELLPHSMETAEYVMGRSRAAAAEAEAAMLRAERDHLKCNHADVVRRKHATAVKRDQFKAERDSARQYIAELYIERDQAKAERDEAVEVVRELLKHPYKSNEARDARTRGRAILARSPQ